MYEYINYANIGKWTGKVDNRILVSSDRNDLFHIKYYSF